MVGIEYDTGFLIKKMYCKMQGAGKSNKKTFLLMQCSVGLDLLIDMICKEHECCKC